MGRVRFQKGAVRLEGFRDAPRPLEEEALVVEEVAAPGVLQVLSGDLHLVLVVEAEGLQVEPLGVQVVPS